MKKTTKNIIIALAVLLVLGIAAAVLMLTGTPAEEEAESSSSASSEAAEKLMQVFAEFGKIKHLAPESDAAQALVEALRQCITENYYDCTKPILESLGQMYVDDERFKANIDARGGVGTAEFASKAIEIYCTK